MGRPKVVVCKEDILSLRALNYSWTKIARMLDVSRQTLYRRLDEFNIPSTDFASISSEDLDRTVSGIKENFPNDGEVMLQGHMLRLGIKVPRIRLRATIHNVDHENTVARRSTVVKRRVYSVSHPNAVWHIDGNHKLIRWRFVVGLLFIPV